MMFVERTEPMTFSKTVRLTFALLFVASAAFAGDAPVRPARESEPAPQAQLTRRHGVKRPAAVVLTGRVYDSTRSDPVVSAKVSEGQFSTLTNSQGQYSLSGIDGGTVTITVERWGYETATLQLQLDPGANTHDIAMVSLPEVLVTTASGTSRLDLSSVEFGYLVPFVGAVLNPTLDTCTSDGTTRTLEKSDIARIDGPATRVAAGPCCHATQQAEMVHITLKDSTVIEALLPTSCAPYDMNIVGLDKGTLATHFLRLKDATSIVFP